MPIKLITGQPGNGKTLYAVYLINEALKQGREVYTNINFLNGVCRHERCAIIVF